MKSVSGSAGIPWDAHKSFPARFWGCSDYFEAFTAKDSLAAFEVGAKAIQAQVSCADIMIDRFASASLRFAGQPRRVTGPSISLPAC